CSRIEHETAAEKIGVSPSVVESVSKEKDIVCRKIGSVSLRGKATEMDLYEVVWREEAKAAAAQEGPAKISGKQLAISSGTRIEVNEDVRRAIAATIRGETPGPRVPAAERKRFVLVEIKGDRTAGRRFPLKGSPAVAGREGAEIPFPDAPQMSPQHALFSVLGGGLYVEDLDSGDGTYVQIVKPRTLQSGDLVILGSIGFRVEITPAEPTVKVELVQLADDGSELERYPLERGETTIGRVRGTYVFGEDAFMSGQHARIVVHGDICALHDLKSSNGTFIRIREKELLDIDDTVMIGGKRLRVEVEDAPADELEPLALPALLQPDTARPLVAVLEFENLAGDGGAGWLATGLAETLTADLNKLDRLRLAGRERVQEARRKAGGKSGARQLGRLLGARWVITGSYQRIGERIRLTPRLLDVNSGEETAVGKVDGRWEDLFALQDQVAVELLRALQEALGETALERRGPTAARQVEAYEHYAQGRQEFFKLGKTSLEAAREHFERAVALDDGYALAHSALGATFSMRYVHRTDPDDLVQARSNLERALEIDPELAEPYPWLCYICSRQGEFEKALRAGLKGVQRQPDLVQAFYFLGCVYVFYVHLDTRYWQQAADCLQAALGVEPRWRASYLVLSWVAAMNGLYDEAETINQRGGEMDLAGKSIGAFPYSHLVMQGGIQLRRGEWDRAAAAFEEAVASLPGTDRMYRDAILALAYCGLGDAELRRGHADTAEVSFRRAWKTIEDYPTVMGSRRLQTRALIGQAHAGAKKSGAGAASAEAGLHAAEQLAQLAREPQTWVWEAATPQLLVAFAGLQLQCGEKAAALASLEQAAAQGWRDHTWLANDPELAPLHKEERFKALLEKLRVFPPLTLKPKTPGAAP
ncbi:MAG: FHA domain-containing protein, partial [Candidatus Acidiferrales bacterium]